MTGKIIPLFNPKYLCFPNVLIFHKILKYAQEITRSIFFKSETTKSPKGTETMKKGTKNIEKEKYYKWKSTIELVWLTLLLHHCFKKKIKKNHHKSQMYTIIPNLLFTRKHNRNPIRSCHLNNSLNMRRNRQWSHCDLFHQITCKNRSEWGKIASTGRYRHSSMHQYGK